MSDFLRVALLTIGVISAFSLVFVIAPVLGYYVGPIFHEWEVYWR